MILIFNNRKIQKVKYSYLLSLPVSWIKTMKLEKSSVLGVEMCDDYSLRIYPIPAVCQDPTENGVETTTVTKGTQNE